MTDYKLELEPGVWFCDWMTADPGHTKIKKGAYRFMTKDSAEAALTVARRYSPYPNAIIRTENEQ